MSPVMKYTLGRLGLFAAAALALWPVPQLSPLVKLMAALAVSFGLSWFLLRRWREQMSAHLVERMERRRVEKERLRAALAGEDERPSGEARGSGPAG
jgi:hypothetical protein